MLTLTKLIRQGNVPIEVIAASMEYLSKFCAIKNIVLKLAGKAAGHDQEVIFKAMRWSKEKMNQEEEKDQMIERQLFS